MTRRPCFVIRAAAKLATARPHADLNFEGRCIKIAHDVAFARAFAFQDSIDDPVAIAIGTFMFTRTAGVLA